MTKKQHHIAVKNGSDTMCNGDEGTMRKVILKCLLNKIISVSVN